MAHDLRPMIFYFNPNIFPAREYEIRKEESKRHAETLGLRWIDGDYDHASWREAMKGLEREPERGRRCEACFAYRMLATAHMAQQTGVGFFATTLASSRWKDLEQVNAAGLAAAEAVPGTTFWAQNWRKDGLQERRNQLLKEYQFYNQLYCGCEYSLASSKAMEREAEKEKKEELRLHPIFGAAGSVVFLQHGQLNWENNLNNFYNFEQRFAGTSPLRGPC